MAFDGRKRIIGVAAKNQQVTNMKNTVTNVKRLLGRKFDDPYVQHELKNIPTKVEAMPDGGIGFRVSYLDKEQLFTPEQLTAMLFTKLKDTSSHALQAQVLYWIYLYSYLFHYFIFTNHKTNDKYCQYFFIIG